MGLISKAIGLTGWTSLAAAGTWVALTRKNRIVSIPASDYIFNTTHYARYNPYNSPVTQDLCLRQVPLDQLRPEYVEKEGRLVEKFCAGVWSGVGYAYQRRYLEKKYRSDPITKDHLWDKKELNESNYDVGTKITDHFEVVSKTPESIIVRCGDSPRLQDVRESDGLFEMSVDVRKEEGVAEFGLKSVFYNGLTGYKGTATPMPPHVQWLHQQYDKVLMESALRNVMK